MLTIDLGEIEYYDESIEEFVTLEARTLEFEHSLVSLSKWEEKWEKPFLGPDKKTTEETISYVECMCVTPEPPEHLGRLLSTENFKQINSYIAAKMTATWFSDPKKGSAPTREIITAELIYYWMIALNIPFECQYWHLNKLMTLIRVCNVKNQPEKKMSKADLASRNRALNRARQAQYGTRG